MAESFRPMHADEAAHNAVLWAHRSDAEGIAIEQALVATIPPQAMPAALR